MKDLHDDETRTTDYATGGQKGAKLTRLGAMDPVAIIELARVAGMGAEKYEAFNYLRGFDWSLAFNAMQRHALLFWSGEDNDPESGLSHMAHASWMALCLVSFALRELGTDDRFKQPPSPAPGFDAAAFDRMVLAANTKAQLEQLGRPVGWNEANDPLFSGRVASRTSLCGADCRHD